MGDEGLRGCGDGWITAGADIVNGGCCRGEWVDGTVTGAVGSEAWFPTTGNVSALTCQDCHLPASITCSTNNHSNLGSEEYIIR